MKSFNRGMSAPMKITSRWLMTILMGSLLNTTLWAETTPPKVYEWKRSVQKLLNEKMRGDYRRTEEIAPYANGGMIGGLGLAALGWSIGSAGKRWESKYVRKVGHVVTINGLMAASAGGALKLYDRKLQGEVQLPPEFSPFDATRGDLGLLGLVQKIFELEDRKTLNFSQGSREALAEATTHLVLGAIAADESVDESIEKLCRKLHAIVHEDILLYERRNPTWVRLGTWSQEFKKKYALDDKTFIADCRTQALRLWALEVNEELETAE